MFGQLLGRLASDGLGVCLVEHDVALVMQVCSIIYVLDYGAILASGSAQQIQEDPAVIAAYLGTTEGAA
jgi:branched-chain amino acid transport system ATP-binding protein